MASNQLALGNPGIALILAIGKKMLGRCSNPVGAKWLPGHDRPLQAQGHRAGISGDQRRVCRIAFIAAPPAQILRHSQGWREGPFDPAGGHFGGRGRADPLDQCSVICGPQPDVVREDRSIWQVRVAMDGIDPEQDRNARAALARCLAVFGDQPVPLGSVCALVAIGAGVAPARIEPSG